VTSAGERLICGRRVRWDDKRAERAYAQGLWVRETLADTLQKAARLEVARQLVLHAVAMKDSNLPSLKEASMAKLVASETAEAVVSGAIQTLGGYGYLEEFGIAKILSGCQGGPDL
jgi:alkylation response protein AidB-like acyl-CoA dehydrogenase